MSDELVNILLCLQRKMHLRVTVNQTRVLQVVPGNICAPRELEQTGRKLLHKATSREGGNKLVGDGVSFLFLPISAAIFNSNLHVHNVFSFPDWPVLL